MTPRPLHLYSSDVGKVQYISSLVILTDRPPQLAAWYGLALGLTFSVQEEDTWYAMIRTDIGPIHIGIGPRRLLPESTPGSSMVVSLRVEDFDEAVERLRGAEIAVQIKDSEDGRFAFFNDLDGNPVGIWGK
ncbi:MAG: hypothetical protein JRI25_20820 [Deltaproteobacteria bacterium]|nr:hypothetical protein [Deltaproteobacteria bacterium]MBW2257016.1 hypothetical protein [Deltaproteobacteria bacterium]